VLSLRRLDDFDTWWHLAAGRWIFEHRSVPRVDVLSYTVSDHAWTNLQWLYDLLLYGLYRLGGADALVIAACVCLTLTLGIVALRVRGSLGPVASAVLVLWVTVIASERFMIRPEMLTFVLFVAVIAVLHSARDDDGRRLWWLVPLMALWVNVHALFVVGLVALGTAMLSAELAALPLLPERWRDASRLGAAARRRLRIWGTAAFAVTLANPYGLAGALFPFAELLSRIDGSSNLFQTIGEFQRPFSGHFPTFSLRAYQLYLFGSIAVVASAGVLEARRARTERPARFDLAGLGLWVALLWLSLLARRNIGLFAIGSAPFVAACAGVVAAQLPAPAAVWRARARLAGGVGVGLALVVLCGLVVTNTWYARSGEAREFGLGVFEPNFPIRATRFAREQRLPGPFYNDLTAGGYLSFDAPTEHGVYIDGRLEVYDERFFATYQGTLGDARVFDAEVARHGIQSVLLFHRWRNRHPLIRFLVQRSDWAPVYFDEVAILFVRVPGNMAAIRSAQESFETWIEEIRRDFMRPTRSWAYPVQRYTGMSAFASLLETLGRGVAAREMYRAMLELPLPPADAANARARLALLERDAG
jgi:hypothetical protein